MTAWATWLTMASAVIAAATFLLATNVTGGTALHLTRQCPHQAASSMASFSCFIPYCHNMTEGTFVVAFVWLAFIGANPSLWYGSDSRYKCKIYSYVYKGYSPVSRKLSGCSELSSFIGNIGMKSGVVSWWMDALLGCLQLSNRPQRCQGVLCWPQMPLHYRNCNWLDAQALARCMPPALCVLLLERGLNLTDPQSEDVRPLTAVNGTIARRRRNRFVLRANQMLGWDGQTIGHTPEKIHITWMSAPRKSAGIFLAHQQQRVTHKACWPSGVLPSWDCRHRLIHTEAPQITSVHEIPIFLMIVAM